jgi:hypothetical protein
MSIFNIPQLGYDSTFEGLYRSHREIIEAVNQIALVDVQAGASQGIYEVFRGGGVVMLGISAGTAIGFEAGGELTLTDTGETPKSRTAQTDKFVVIDNSGVAQFVEAINVLPSQVDKDIVFTGDISFSGDLSFLTSGVLAFESDSAFRDKVLELSAKFEDRLEFATASDPLPTAGITAYLYDNDSGSSFNSADPLTYLGRGAVLGATDAISSNYHITLEEFVFNESQQFFREFTNAGATAGGRYSLVDNAGATLGRGLVSYFGAVASSANQTSPINADASGLAVMTNDGVVYSGGTTGQKLFIWRYNGSTAASAWTSSENLEILGDLKSLIAHNLQSRNDRIVVAPELGNSNVLLGFGGSVGASAGIGFQYVGGATSALSVGPFDGSSLDFSLRFYDNQTMQAGTTGVARNLNADLLDGAHGATLGGSPNLVPITDATGKIHSSFIEGAEQVDELITQTSHGFVTGHVLYQQSNGDYGLASAASASANAAEAVGVVSRVIDANTFVLTYFGIIGISGFSTALGWTTNGTDEGLLPGEVYFLDTVNAGYITSGDPQIVGTVGQLRKPIAIGLSGERAFITHYVGSAVFSLDEDIINAKNLVPAGTIYNIGGANPPTGDDWLVCDGKAYASTSYPDLATEIAGRFYLEANPIPSSRSFIIPGTTTGVNADAFRGFTTGFRLRIEYENSSNGLTSAENANIDTLAFVSTGLQINLVDSAGNAYVTDFPAVNGQMEIYGRESGAVGTACFVVPDLRARGVIGTGTPDGPGGEDNMRPGEIADLFTQEPQFTTSAIAFDLTSYNPTTGLGTNSGGTPNSAGGTRVYIASTTRLTFVSVSPPQVGFSYQVFLQTRENSSSSWTTLASQSVESGFVGNVNGYVPASWQYRIVKTAGNIDLPAGIESVITTL